jgi:NhaP-type Na+/H+ or K+/H+ antiporter
MFHKVTQLNRYMLTFVLVICALVLNYFSPFFLDIIKHLDSTESIIAGSFWCASIILGFGWLAAKFSTGTIIPSFVSQMILSIILHDALYPLTAQPAVIVVVCTALAALILKGGGDEIDQKEFVKIAFPTVCLALGGYIITFFVSLMLFSWAGLDLTLATVLAAIVGSTDPAALIPTLKNIVFKPKHQKLVDISVGESAINDALGAIFTGAVLSIVVANSKIESVPKLFVGVFSLETISHLGLQFASGAVAGVIGFGVMLTYQKLKSINSEKSVDFAVVILTPILAFLIAQLLHGNGYFAAFLTGLLANYNHNTEIFQKTLHTMEIAIESIGKPVIFMMVGPLVSLKDLGSTAVMGILVSLIFIFVARPIAVFVSTILTKLSIQEKLFLCAIRETGVIPIVLAVVASKQIPILAPVLPLTAWVVIVTLLILPAVTPLWSRFLGLTESK